MSSFDKNRRKSKRNELNTNVEFIISADIVKAQSVNISEHGIRLDTESPLEIEMRFTLDGKEEEHVAKLCWVERQEGNGYAYGFEFK